MAARWNPAYVALGSNQDEPERQIERAFIALAEIPGSLLVMRSRVYRSAPLGPIDQPDFLNAVAALLTTLDPVGLLAALQAIETRQGRRRGETWGPRTLDLDLLLCGQELADHPELTLPHPGLHRRNFVLYPLAEIAPALVVPGHGRVLDIAQALGSDGLRLLDDTQ